MEPSRKVGMALVLLAVLAWTAYCLFFLVLLRTPAVDGAVEDAERTRLMIMFGLLSGLAVGAVAALWLWRGVFDDTPPQLRVRLAIAGAVMLGALGVALYWAGLSSVLLFLWGPTLGAVLLLTAWASRRPRRAEASGESPD